MPTRTFGDEKRATVDDALFRRFEGLTPHKVDEVGSREHLQALQGICTNGRERKQAIMYCLAWLEMSIKEVCPVIPCPYDAQSEVGDLAKAIAKQRNHRSQSNRFDRGKVLA